MNFLVDCGREMDDNWYTVTKEVYCMAVKLMVWEQMVRAGMRRQKELAQKTGISEGNISNLMKGNTKAIQFRTLESLCDALDCGPGDLIKIEK